jgi:hypothetical protein
MSADYACLAIDPNDPDGPRIEVVFPARYTLGLYKHAPVDFENLRAAKYVLENTARLFYGVREFSEGGWCYTGRPQAWYIKERIEAPFPRTLVFAVYVNERMRVFECRAEVAAEDDPMSPKGWRTRYRGLIWPKDIS